MNTIDAKLITFVHFHCPPGEFEQWVYATPELEDYFGDELYLELISCSYRQKQQVDELRKSLGAWLEAKYPWYPCQCSRWPSSARLPSCGYTKELVALKRQTEWLELMQCKFCGDHWYVGEDTNNVDTYILRLNSSQVESILDNDRWPEDFVTVPELWPTDEHFEGWGYTSLQDWQAKNGLLNDDLRKSYSLAGEAFGVLRNKVYALVRGAPARDVRDRTRGLNTALELYRQAAALAAPHWADDHPMQISRRSRIGEILYMKGELRAAAELQDKVVSDFSKLVHGDNHTLQYYKMYLAKSLKQLGELTRAEHYEVQALEAMRRRFPDDNPNVAIMEKALGETRALMGK